MAREGLLLTGTYASRMEILSRQSRLLRADIGFEQSSSRSDNADHRLTNQKLFRNQEHQRHSELRNVCFTEVRMTGEGQLNNAERLADLRSRSAIGRIYRVYFSAHD